MLQRMRKILMAGALAGAAVVGIPTLAAAQPDAADPEGAGRTSPAHSRISAAMADPGHRGQMMSDPQMRTQMRTMMSDPQMRTQMRTMMSGGMGMDGMGMGGMSDTTP